MGKGNRKHYTAIDAFSGAGGLSLGLTDAKFDILCAFDNNEKCVYTYNENLGKISYKADASGLTGQKLLRKAKTKQIDLFAGGPPCQGFSKQKKGAYLLNDTRNTLIIEYARLVFELQPKTFLLENVEMLGKKRCESILNEAKKYLTDYHLYPSFYNSADYGLAQIRKRFILVGIRNDIQASYNIPKPLTSKRKTVFQIIGDLPEPPADYTDHPQFPNHQKTKVNALNVLRFSYVPPGGGWKDIPEHLKLTCHKKVDTSTGGWTDVFGRLKWDGQCPTITGGFDCFSRGRFGHPEQHRPLTLREGARLQGFPDWFIFYGTRQDIRYQIGNAVPPLLAKKIGMSIKRVLLAEDGYSDQNISRDTKLDKISLPDLNLNFPY